MPELSQEQKFALFKHLLLRQDTKSVCYEGITSTFTLINSYREFMKDKGFLHETGDMFQLFYEFHQWKKAYKQLKELTNL